MEVRYRKARRRDLAAVVEFVDFWLRSGGVADKIPGASNDCFVPVGRHEKYLKKYEVWLALLGDDIVGWSVKTSRGVLIHLLVAGTFRGSRIGSTLLELSNPDTIRSKMDQTTGNPEKFYKKFGYVKSSGGSIGRNKNIEVFSREARD